MPNGGSTPSTPAQTVSWLGTPTNLSNPTRANSTFSGWYTTQNFEEGTKVTTNVIPSDGPVTLYAKYVCSAPYVSNADNTACVQMQTVTLDAGTNG